MAAGSRFHTEAGLLTSFVTALPFPVSQWIARPLPYTVTASLRIPTGFPFHLLLKQTPLCYNFIFFQTVGLYHILSNCQSVLMVGLSKILCGIFSFRAVRRKAVAVKFYVGFLIKSDLCRKRHRHLTEDAGAFLLECSGNQLNNSSSFCGSVPSLAYGSASNCRKLCLMSFVSSLKPRMYESAM